MPRCPFLADCTDRFEKAAQSFEALVSNIEPRQANWKPGPKRWSVAECIDHVNVTAFSYFPRIEDAIDRGRERQLLGTAPYRRWSFLGRMILKILDPAANHKAKAPSVFRPEEGTLDFDEVSGRFRVGIERLRMLAQEADGLDLGRVRLASPATPFPRLTLAEAFEIQALHIPRHLGQAKTVSEMEGFWS